MYVKCNVLQSMIPKRNLLEKICGRSFQVLQQGGRTLQLNLVVSIYNIYENYTNLTEEKFRHMLKLWLNVNPKPVDELCETFCQGLQGIELNAAAKQFKDNYEKFKANEALK